METAAGWLLRVLRRVALDNNTPRHAEFATFERRLVKIGARMIDSASRICIAFASACPERAAFVAILRTLKDEYAPNQQAP